MVPARFAVQLPCRHQTALGHVEVSAARESQGLQSGHYCRLFAAQLATGAFVVNVSRLFALTSGLWHQTKAK